MIKTVGLYDAQGNVVNRIVFDTNKSYTPPDALSIIDDPDANIGDTVVDGVLVQAEEPETDILEEGA